MKITTLGTNGWFDSVTGQTMCTLIRTEDYNLILDAGFGIHKIKNLIDFAKPAILLLSHLHYDHTVGLHMLNYFNFEKPLKIVLPTGQKEELHQMCRAPYTSDWSRVPFEIQLFDTGELEKAELPFGLKALWLSHPVPDMGYRLEIEGKIVTYLCDTGYCNNAIELAKDADLVISECGSLPGQALPGWPHMDPSLGAKLAREAGARQVLLTHFSAADYQSIAQRQTAVDSARPIFSNLITGVDDLEIIL